MFLILSILSLFLNYSVFSSLVTYNHIEIEISKSVIVRTNPYTWRLCKEICLKSESPISLVYMKTEPSRQVIDWTSCDLSTHSFTIRTHIGSNPNLGMFKDTIGHYQAE